MTNDELNVSGRTDTARGRPLTFWPGWLWQMQLAYARAAADGKRLAARKYARGVLKNTNFSNYAKLVNKLLDHDFFIFYQNK